MNKVECPVCRGTGLLDTPRKRKGDRKKEMIRTLIDSGFSYREVQDLMGYKSPGSVQRAMEGYAKKN